MKTFSVNYYVVLDMLLEKVHFNKPMAENLETDVIKIVETKHLTGIKQFSDEPISWSLAARLSGDNSFSVITNYLAEFDFVADRNYPIFSAIKASKHPDACKGLTKFAVYQKDIDPAMKRQIYENLYAVAKEELVIVEIY